VTSTGSAGGRRLRVGKQILFSTIIVCSLLLLVEGSIRYVLSNPGLTTTLVGLSTLEQLEHAGNSAKKGPLPDEALKLISSIQQGFVGEAR